MDIVNNSRIDRVDFQRLRVVLSLIEKQPDAPLAVETVAAAAGMSPAHFHRRFVRLLGNRPGRYIRERRLDMGADLLMAYPSWSVLDVAIAVGFGSGEAFIRAFRARFAEAPARWRRRQLAMTVSRNCQNDPCESRYRGIDVPENFDDAVRIVEQPNRYLAGLAYTGPYGAPVGEFLRTRFYPWCAAQGIHHRDVFGITLDNPNVVPANACRYQACVPCEQDESVHDAELQIQLPAGPYAQFDFHGSVGQIGAAWHHFFNWLAASQFEFGGHLFEYYPARCRGDSPADESGLHSDFHCTLCIALSPDAVAGSDADGVRRLRIEH